MIQLTYTQISNSAQYALISSCTIVAILFTTFFLAEPTISHGQADTEVFTISQTIIDETSFLTIPSDITMAGTVYGVTGGQATGTTDFAVISNNTAGYYVEIDFFDNTTPEAMIGDESSSEAIRDYGGVVGLNPSFTYTASTAAQFAYTVSSDTPGDTDGSFLDNGTLCGTGGSNQTAARCWMAPSTTPYRIVDRNSAATTGATSTLTFNVTVPSGANPLPQAETYTATATLSVFVK